MELGGPEKLLIYKTAKKQFFIGRIILSTGKKVISDWSKETFHMASRLGYIDLTVLKRSWVASP